MAQIEAEEIIHKHNQHRKTTPNAQKRALLAKKIAYAEDWELIRVLMDAF